MCSMGKRQARQRESAQAPKKGVCGREEQGVSVAGVDGGHGEKEEIGSDIMSGQCGPDL